jgi:hypothetical protein
MPSTNGHGSKPERVALYLRVSSEEQRDRETIELQREFLEQYCNLHELEVTGVYADNGVSGTIPVHERPEGRRLLEDAGEGQFGAVLVYRLDRLGRSLLVIAPTHRDGSSSRCSPPSRSLSGRVSESGRRLVFTGR